MLGFARDSSSSVFWVLLMLNCNESNNIYERIFFCNRQLNLSDIWTKEHATWVPDLTLLITCKHVCAWYTVVHIVKVKLPLYLINIPWRYIAHRGEWTALRFCSFISRETALSTQCYGIMSEPQIWPGHSDTNKSSCPFLESYPSHAVRSWVLRFLTISLSGGRDCMYSFYSGFQMSR
jgi:hypothetical protein